MMRIGAHPGSLRLAAAVFGIGLALLGCVAPGCDRSETAAAAPAESRAEATRPTGQGSSSPRPRGPLDVTFFVTADTHLGHSAKLPARTRLNPGARPKTVDLGEVHQHIVGEMAAMSGRAYPSAIGGSVGRPRALLVAGDLTESGQPHEWQQFLRYYGGSSADSGVPLPVFEVIGNHDRVGPAAQSACQRHGGCAYAVWLDGLRVIALSDGPDAQGLALLRSELARLGPRTPVVLFFHYPLLGPFSGRRWFSDGDHRDELRRVISGHRIVAIFHGHFHGSGHYRWHGYDVYNVGSAKHRYRSFAVAHLSDERLSVCSYNYEAGRWWWWHAKPVAATKAGATTGGAAGAEVWGVDPGPGGRNRPSHPYPR